jgi:hypothetical protein
VYARRDCKIVVGQSSEVCNNTLGLVVGDTVGEVPDHFSHFSHDVTDDN